MAKRTHKRKPGRLGEREKVAINLIHDINPDASFAAIAKILNRRQGAITTYVRTTRDMLRYAAPRYLELHMKAASIAASEGNAAPAQWALERIEMKDEETGDSIRVVDAPAGLDRSLGSVGTGLTVNVGIALSQVQPTAEPHPSLIDITPEPARIEARVPMELAGVSVNPKDSDT